MPFLYKLHMTSNDFFKHKDLKFYIKNEFSLILQKKLYSIKNTSEKIFSISNKNLTGR